MPVDTLDLKKRLDSAIAARKNLDATLDQVEKWVGPLSGGVPVDRTATEGMVNWQRREVWDSTAPDGADKLAAHIFTNITNPSVQWAKLAWESKKLQENTEANKWIEDATEKIFAELKTSDFYDEFGKFSQEWVRYGTAVLVAEALHDALSADGWKGLDFTAPPIRECYYDPDYAGNVLRFWRVLNWTAGQIISKFGADEVPQKVRDQAANPDQSASRMKIVYAVWVRPEQMGKKKTAPLAPELRPVGHCYFLFESAELCGKEDGFYEMPVYIVPWSQTPGSDYGHGPGIRVLPDVRTLNDTIETQRMAARKAVDPAFTVTERGLVSDVNLEAGGMTVTRNPDDLKVFESGSKYAVGEHDIADQRAQIRARFWTDELTLKLSPQMTATEVRARIDQMQKLFGPTLAGLQSKALNPLLQLVFSMLYRASRLLPMPPQVKQEVLAAGGDFNIEYQGPLSMAQRMDEVAAQERIAAFVAALEKAGFPEARLTFNADAAVREVAKRLGTPASILYSADEVKAKVKAEQDMQRQAMQAEIAKTQGQALNQAAQANAAGASMPAQPMPLVSPEAGGGLM